MPSPTDQQQIRSTLRRHARNNGDGDAADLALTAATEIVGVPCVANALTYWAKTQNLAQSMQAMETRGLAVPLPPLMGTAEVAEEFGIANSNISKLSDRYRPEPVARISGGKVPVYLASEVRAKAEARRAAKVGDGDA